MRFLFLLSTFLLCISASSQSPTMPGMAANMQQTINNQISNIQQQLTNAKANNAPPKQIEELEQKLEAMKIAQKAMSQYTPRKTKPQPKGPPGSRWTGYLSAVKKGGSDFPQSKRETYIDLYFNEAIPTLHRTYNENDELAFQDDKGIGSLKDHAELLYGTEWLICNCSTVGEAELHEVVVNSIAGTYTIQADAPGCDDGKGSCGMTWDISISDEPLKNPNVLSGTKTYEAEVGPYKANVTMTWYLVRDVNVELIVKPRGYDDWLPEPGTDEKTVGKKPITVDLLLQGKNGKPLTHKAKSFELRLNNTSREPGITINFPLSPVKNGTPPDLQFLERVNAEIENEAQVMKIECDDCITTTFKIGAFDGGGFTTLTAIAVLDDDSHIVGHLINSNGVTDVPIPKRKQGSIIGEKWMKDYGNLADDFDGESSIGNENDGDGLSAYEEYRGVIKLGEFKRLSPSEKELGLLLKPAEVGLFTEGITRFSRSSDVTILRFDPKEIPDNRRLNQNNSSAHVFDQYVLRVQNGNTKLPDMTGEIQAVFGIAYGGADIPAHVRHIVVDVAAIREFYQRSVAHYGAARVPFTDVDLIASTTAHEIGHGVNVAHHGRKIPRIDGLTATDPRPAIQIFVDGTEITTRPYTIEGPVASPGNHESGNVSCFMCYRNKEWWMRKIGNNNELLFYRIPLMRAGSLFCVDKTGTGINTNNNYFGDAFKGNCLGQIKLKD